MKETVFKYIKRHWKLIMAIFTSLTFIIVLLLIMVNFLVMGWSSELSRGDSDVWLSIWGAVVASVIGGVISGGLTLSGVILTIKSTDSSKENDISIQSTRDRLFNFYHPIDNKLRSFVYKHKAHNFSDLESEEQTELLALLSDNIVYADSKVYKLILEMQWMFSEENSKYLNEHYIILGEYVFEEIDRLRSQLKLPKIDIEE